MSDTSALSHPIAEIVAAAQAYAKAAMPENTRLAYVGDWKRFDAYCKQLGVESLPGAPATVATYLSSLGLKGQAYATIARALAGICFRHLVASLPSPRFFPEVKIVMKGIKNTHGAAPKRRSAALSVDELRALSEAMPDGLVGLRDRAMLVVGYVAAMRRSELAKLKATDITFDKQGVAITIHGGKADKKKRGDPVYLPNGVHPSTCPARTLQAWLAAANIAEGLVFLPCRVRVRRRKDTDKLSGRMVARALKRACARVGIPSDKIAGHSLRRGFITAAIRAGKRPSAVMKQSRHVTMASLQVYISEAEGFTDNAAAGIGL